MKRILLSAALVAAFAVTAFAQRIVVPNADGTQSSAVALYSGGAQVGAANPLPVGTPKLAYSGPASATVGTSSGVLFAQGAYSRLVQVCTLLSSTANVWLRLDGGVAAANAGVAVPAGGGCAYLGPAFLPLPTANVTAITDGGVSQTVTLTGG
jgi:hypothetical protein